MSSSSVTSSSRLRSPGGFWTFKNRDANSRVVQGLPFVRQNSGRTGTSLCAATIGRGCRKKDPKGLRWSPLWIVRLLNSVWQERISRILDIEDRRIQHILIEPDLLATFLAGTCINTMKLNKNRLKQMAQSGRGGGSLPFSLKRKKPDEGSSKQAEEAPSRPSAPIATPPVIPTAVPSVPKAPTVIMVDSDLTPSVRGLYDKPESLFVAMDRAKGAISSQDMDEYAVAHTDDLSLLMVHSLMRVCFCGGRSCSSSSQVNCGRGGDEERLSGLVMELTRERKEALAEAENLRKELKARDDDVKAAVDAKDKAVADLKHLVGQIEGAKEAAVSEFRASEAFEDINTRYFLSGFEAFRKQAVQCFPRSRFLRSPAI
uniref:Uncharacterized protein n=1 Tax=Fagus sylvatica TaxID=28930 RepID=A0A2N9G844_FAGSY